MSNYFDDLTAMAEEGSFSKAEVAKVIKEGESDLLRGLWENLSRCSSAAELRTVHTNELRLFSLIYGTDSPIVASIARGLESNDYDEKATALINSGMLTAEHPAGAVPVMYEDENNKDNYFSLLNSISVLGVKEEISLNTEGLILNGQQRFRCSIMAGNLNIPFKTEENWTVEDKWATLAGRNLTAAQKIGLAHSLGYRDSYRGKEDVANAIGVSKASMALFEKRRQQVNESTQLNSNECLNMLVNGKWTLQDYARAGVAAACARQAAAAMKQADMPFTSKTNVSVEDAKDPFGYFEGLEQALMEMTQEQIDHLENVNFPKRLVPDKFADVTTASVRQDFWQDAVTEATMVSLDAINGVIIFGDDLEKIKEARELLLSNFEGSDCIQETQSARIIAYTETIVEAEKSTKKSTKKSAKK